MPNIGGPKMQAVPGQTHWAEPCAQLEGEATPHVLQERHTPASSQTKPPRPPRYKRKPTSSLRPSSEDQSPRWVNGPEGPPPRTQGPSSVLMDPGLKKDCLTNCASLHFCTFRTSQKTEFSVLPMTSWEQKTSSLQRTLFFALQEDSCSVVFLGTQTIWILNIHWIVTTWF